MLLPSISNLDALPLEVPGNVKNACLGILLTIWAFALTSLDCRMIRLRRLFDGQMSRCTSVIVFKDFAVWSPNPSPR